MRRTLPPTHDLACFEAVVRHGGVTRAAEELNLTQSAVSRRIGSLESLLGEKLFVREKQRLTPTPAAEEYAQELSGLLNRIEVATTHFLAHGRKGGVLTVACLPTFGSRWLVPRLGRFLAAHPTIDINLISKIKPFSFDDEPAHVAIHFGLPHWPGAKLRYLMDEYVVPVCAPSLVPEGPLEDVEDLRRFTLIQHTTRPYLWRDWLRHVGASAVNGLAGPKFEYYSLVIQAALAGIGVALLPEFLIREELDAGLLVMPVARRMRCSEAYYVVYQTKYEGHVNVTAFADWLVGECRAFNAQAAQV